MNDYENAARGNGRRPIDFATCSSLDCTSDDVCRAYVAGDAGAAARIDRCRSTVPLALWPDVLALAVVIGKRGDA